MTNYNQVFETILETCGVLYTKLANDENQFQHASLNDVQESNQKKIEMINQLNTMAQHLRDSFNQSSHDLNQQILLKKVQSALLACNRQINKNMETLTLYVNQVNFARKKSHNIKENPSLPLYDKQGKTSL